MHSLRRIALGSSVIVGALTLVAPAFGDAVSAPQHPASAVTHSTGTTGALSPDVTSVAGALAAMRSAGSAQAAGASWHAAQRAALTSALVHAAPAAAASEIEVFLGGGCGLDDESSSGSSSGAAGVKTVRQLDQLLPAGNLNGRGGPDVLDYRLGIGRQTVRSAFTARDGATGKALWSRASRAGDLQAPFADRVGPRHQPGVLLIGESDSLSGDTETLTLTIRALSGAGSVLWSRHAAGQISFTDTTETLTHVPELGGLIHDVSGRGSDLLLGETNGSDDGSTGHFSLQPEVVSSRDGTIADRGALLSSTVGLPMAQVVPGGTSPDDIAIAVPGKPGHLVERRGDTGTTIWTSGALPSSSLVDAATAVGLLSGGHREDIAVESLRESGGPSESVSLIRGSDGRVLWTHQADCVMPLLKAGHQLVGAVGLVTEHASGGSRSATGRVVDTARAADGRVIYRRSYVGSIHQHAAAHSTSVDIEVSGVGDVQPDGSADIGLQITATIGKKTVTRRGVISGRTGAIITEPSEYPTDGSLHRGHGTDLVKPHATVAGLQLTGYDGASGRQLFTTILHGTKGLKDAIIDGLRVSGHRCSDLGVSATSRHKVVLGLFTANGQPRWTVTTRTSRLTGGNRRRHTVTGPDCV